MTKRNTPLTQRRGSTLVEAAIILPILLMFLLGILEYSRFVMMRNLLDNAAREGARQAVVNTYDWTTSQVQAVVTAKLAGQGGQLGNLSIQVFEANPATGAYADVWTNAQFGDSIMVQITGTYRPIVPRLLMMNSSIPMQAQAMMSSEAN